MQQKQGTRVSTSIVDQLEHAIEIGSYLPNARLPSEREMCEIFGVSRPVIREALRVLQGRGLVQIRHGAGVFVRPRTEPAMNIGGLDSNAGPFEVIEARRLLEGEIAALAAQSINEAQLAEMQVIISRIGDMRLDQAAREQADRSFHVALARSTGNEVLASIVGNLWDMRSKSALCEYYFRRAREAGIQPPQDEHQLVWDALKARNSERARQVMRDHLTHVTRNLLIASEEDVRERTRLRVEERRFDYARRAGVKV